MPNGRQRLTLHVQLGKRFQLLLDGVVIRDTRNWQDLCFLEGGVMYKDQLVPIHSYTFQ